MNTQIKRKANGFLILFFALIPGLLQAQVETIAISTIKPIPSLEASVKPEKKLELGRIIESLDSQLIDRVNATRKFSVVDRSNLKTILQEITFGDSGIADPATVAKAGKLSGAKYMLITTVDDFQDYVDTATFTNTGRSLTKRIFRLSLIGKLYESSTGKLLESANIQTGNDAFKTISENHNYSVKDGNLSDEMMVAVARSLAQQIAWRVVSIIYPPKILDVDHKKVTISWGEGLPISIGETWEVCFPRTKTNDVDTVFTILKPVGKVKINRVDATSSEGDIVGQDLGIVEHCVLRKPQ